MIGDVATTPQSGKTVAKQLDRTGLCCGLAVPSKRPTSTIADRGGIQSPPPPATHDAYCAPPPKHTGPTFLVLCGNVFDTKTTGKRAALQYSAATPCQEKSPPLLQCHWSLLVPGRCTIDLSTTRNEATVRLLHRPRAALLSVINMARGRFQLSYCPHRSITTSRTQTNGRVHGYTVLPIQNKHCKPYNGHPEVPHARSVYPPNFFLE